MHWCIIVLIVPNRLVKQAFCSLKKEFKFAIKKVVNYLLNWLLK